MGILKRAPKVQIYVPKTLFVGRPCDVDVVIDADEPIDVEYVSAEIEGNQGWAVGSGKSRVSRRELVPRLETQLMGAGQLPVGTTRLPTRFTLPEGTPPSHSLSPAWAQLELRVRVAIPWWFDGKYRFVLPVRVLPPHDVERQPRAFRSTDANAAPDKKRLELSLASTTFVAGETVHGSCALFHVDDRKPRELDLALVPRLELFGRRTRERDADALAVTFTLPAGSAGTNIPFRFELPASTTPSFETKSHRLRWMLVARSGSFFGGKVELAVPITIVDASAAEELPELAVAPRLADARVQQVFDQFAARDGWQRARTTADGEVAIEKHVDETVARLTYSYRGESGTFLVSTLHHPSLGLDLVVTPSSSLRHVFFEDVEVDIAPWDRKHHVMARNAGQAVPFLRNIVPSLQDTAALGELVRWTDDEVSFLRAIAVPEDGELGLVGATLTHLAAVITREAFDIAPPPDVDVDPTSWRALARDLGGTLGMGDLAIDGAIDGTHVSLGVEWREGRPRGVRVSVGDPGAAAGDVRSIELTLARPREEVMTTRAAEPLVEQVIAWPADFVELRVHDGVASALWQLPDGATPSADAARVRTLVQSLRSVLAALAPGAGPYR